MCSRPLHFWLAVPLLLVALLCVSAAALAQDPGECVQDTTQANSYDNCDLIFTFEVTQGPWTEFYYLDTRGGLGACAPLVFTECDCTRGTEVTSQYPTEDMETPVFYGCDPSGQGVDFQVYFDVHEFEWAYPSCSQDSQCPSAQGVPYSQDRPGSPTKYGPYWVPEPECTSPQCI